MQHGKWVMPASNSRPSQGAIHGSYEDQIVAACDYYGCDPGYVINVMYCESGGDPYAETYNYASGNMTRGLFQIDDMWGVSTDPSEQIWWAAEHLTRGDVWWACG